MALHPQACRLSQLLCMRSACACSNKPPSADVINGTSQVACWGGVHQIDTLTAQVEALEAALSATTQERNSTAAELQASCAEGTRLQQSIRDLEVVQYALV